MRIRQKTGRFHQPVLGVVETLRDKLDIIISVERACVPTPLIHCSELVTPGQGLQYVLRHDGSALCFTKKNDQILQNKEDQQKPYPPLLLHVLIHIHMKPQSCCLTNCNLGHIYTQE